MKKIIYTIFFLVTLCAPVYFNRNPLQVRKVADTNNSLHFFEHPIVSPDGVKLYPSFDKFNSTPNTTILEDNFNNWFSFFFTSQLILDVQLTSTLNIRLNPHKLFSIDDIPLLLDKNSTYLIILGNHRGTSSFIIIDQDNWVNLFPDKISSTQENNIMFYYNQNGYLGWNRRITYNIFRDK